MEKFFNVISKFRLELEFRFKSNLPCYQGTQSSQGNSQSNSQNKFAEMTKKFKNHEERIKLFLKVIKATTIWNDRILKLINKVKKLDELILDHTTHSEIFKNRSDFEKQIRDINAELKHIWELDDENKKIKYSCKEYRSTSVSSYTASITTNNSNISSKPTDIENNLMKEKLQEHQNFKNVLFAISEVFNKFKKMLEVIEHQKILIKNAMVIFDKFFENYNQNDQNAKGKKDAKHKYQDKELFLINYVNKSVEVENKGAVVLILENAFSPLFEMKKDFLGAKNYEKVLLIKIALRKIKYWGTTTSNKPDISPKTMIKSASLGLGTLTTKDNVSLRNSTNTQNNYWTKVNSKLITKIRTISAFKAVLKKPVAKYTFTRLDSDKVYEISMMLKYAMVQRRVKLIRSKSVPIVFFEKCEPEDFRQSCCSYMRRRRADVKMRRVKEV